MNAGKRLQNKSVNHTVEIPRGTSRRDAATLIHRAAAKQIRAIDHEGLQAHRETLDMKAFQGGIRIFVQSHADFLKGSPA